MKSQWISMNGGALHYYRNDAGGSDCLVFIHGNSQSARVFERQFQGRLARSFRLFAPDLPGHGLSRPPRHPETDYSLLGYADAVMHLIELLDLQRVILVGSSLGGNVALEMAGRCSRLAGLVLYGVAMTSASVAPEETLLPHPALPVAFSREVSDRQLDGWMHALFALGAEISAAGFREDFLNSDPRAREYLAQNVQAGRYADSVEVLANLDIPVAVLHGREDQLVNIAPFRRLQIPALWRGSVQVIPGAGHTPQYEQPEAFDEILRQFVADLA